MASNREGHALRRSVAKHRNVGPDRISISRKHFTESLMSAAANPPGRSSVAVLLLVVALSGCGSKDPYTRKRSAAAPSGGTAIWHLSPSPVFSTGRAIRSSSAKFCLSSTTSATGRSVMEHLRARTCRSTTFPSPTTPGMVGPTSLAFAAVIPVVRPLHGGTVV